MRRALVAVTAIVASLAAAPAASALPAPATPPLGTSANVSLVTTVPCSFAGIVFKDHYAFATGWATGLTVFDIAVPAAPTPTTAAAIRRSNADIRISAFDIRMSAILIRITAADLRMDETVIPM